MQCPPPLQEYFKHENIIPNDLEKFYPNIFLMMFSKSLEGWHCYCVYFWRRAALFSLFVAKWWVQVRWCSAMTLLAGVWRYIYFLAVSDVTCVISWVVAFSAGRHSKLASPFTNDAGVILNNFIIIGDNYIRTYLTALWKKISLNVNTILESPGTFNMLVEILLQVSAEKLFIWNSSFC